jgi:hypothetical protein
MRSTIVGLAFATAAVTDAVGRYVEHSGGVGTNITWFRRYLDDEIVVALAMNYATKERLPEVIDSLAQSAREAK